MRKKIIFIVGLTLVFMTILGLSYGTFIVNTDKYNASELLVSNLLYGIDLKNADGSKIDGKVVTTSETKTILATITSLNPVDSNYSLEYKITSGAGKVYYSETTGWKPSGFISKDGGVVYVKTVKVVLVPSSTTLAVEFNVNGGYSYNSVLLAMSGYNKIIEEYKDTSSRDNEEPLVDVVKKNNNCESAPCLYGGESKNNYLQYPTASNTTDNIWRIIGNIDNGIKAVSNITGTTTQSNIVNSLNTFYGSLPNTEEYILKTNNFNCIDSGCTGSSKFNNIGLISTYEYNKIGGNTSYLANSNNFFSNNNDTIENITPECIEQTNSSTSSGLRPTVYLSEDVNVTGSGTASDPYRIYSVGKVVTVKYTKNGTPVSELPSKEEYIVNSVTCTGGREGRWDEATNTVILTKGSAPTTCTVDFKAGYTVTMKSNDVTIETPSSKVVGRIGSTSFSFSVTSAYDLSKASVSCNGGASGSVSGSTINITNVTAVNTCTLNIPKKTYAINVSSNDASMGTVSVSPNPVTHGGSVVITLIPKSGYEYASDDCDGTKSGDTITVTNITSTKSCTVTFKQSGVNLAEALKKAYPSSGARTDFSTIYTETKLHTATDYDGSTTYYFTGNPNNWVKFGKYHSDVYFGYWSSNSGVFNSYNSMSECQSASNYNVNCRIGITAGSDMLWRVIRINSDGSVRLLYAGTGNGDGYLGLSQYNNYMNNLSCVSFKYDIDNVSQSSIIFSYLDNWYDKLSNIEKLYINTNAIYCNDRKVVSVFSGTTKFAAYSRIITNSKPTLVCGNSDRFQDGFGLMTADEIVYAGGKYVTDNYDVYYRLDLNGQSITAGTFWWTMTPTEQGTSPLNCGMLQVADSNVKGSLSSGTVQQFFAVRPVISLKSCVTVAPDGNGSGTNPYVVNGTC